MLSTQIRHFNLAKCHPGLHTDEISIISAKSGKNAIASRPKLAFPDFSTIAKYRIMFPLNFKSVLNVLLVFYNG